MAKPKQTGVNKSPTTAQQRLSDLWEEHVQHEFSTRHTEKTLATMVEDAYVNHVPVLTGGSGRDELREFYSKRFIPQMPPDTEMTPVSRTIGDDHSHHPDGLDVAGNSSDRKTRGGSTSRNSPIQRRQAGSRAHLLGPGVGTGSNRIARFRQTARSGN